MSSLFDSILGHARAKTVLETMLQRGRTPHALLFHGAPGIGKATLAQLLAQGLVCGDGGCGACEACRLAAAGNHPDILWIKRQLKKSSKTELSKQIVVDQIRELASLVAVAPRMGVRRVFMIDPADAMNAEAQNALLKTLEEPPPRVTLMLIATRPQVLVDTVRSRCFSLGLSPLRNDELTTLLIERGFDADEAAQRAAMAEGRVGEALELDLDERGERREAILELLERLAQRRGIDRLPADGEAFAGKEEPLFVERLDLMSALLRDAGRLASTGDCDGITHQDLADRLQRLGETLSPARCAELIRTIDRLRDQLRFNLNRKLVSDALLAAVAGGPLP